MSLRGGHWGAKGRGGDREGRLLCMRAKHVDSALGRVVAGPTCSSNKTNVCIAIQLTLPCCVVLCCVMLCLR